MTSATLQIFFSSSFPSLCKQQGDDQTENQFSKEE